MCRPTLIALMLIASHTFAQSDGALDREAASGTGSTLPSITQGLGSGDFILAPNPANDEVRIIPVAQEQRLYALFYDERGNNRLSVEIMGPTSVQLSDVPTGSYMVTTVNSRGTPLSVHRLRVAH